MRAQRLFLVVSLGVATLAGPAPQAAAVAPARADFDGDGFSDLAIGVPGENVGMVEDAGAVAVLYGTASGIAAAGDQLWHQDSPGVPGAAESGDAYGTSLAAGDFDGDGFADLAIGIPSEDVLLDAGGTVADAGAVHVLYGSSAGLAADRDQLWSQDDAGVKDPAEARDSFGQVIATGDFDGDGRDELAIGVPGESVERNAAAGAVNVLRGSSGGLSADGDQLWTQASTDVKGEPDQQDRFGAALATGDFDDDGRADLAIGVPMEDLTVTGGEGHTAVDAGMVNVLYGSASGLTAAGDQVWHQDSRGVKNPVEGYDRFAAALAAGDFDHDGAADLAIGVPGENVGAILNAGAVAVLYGSQSGLTARDQFWSQDDEGVKGVAGEKEDFGRSLAAGDFDSDGPADLAIGVRDTVGSVDFYPGAVNVLYGGGSGLTTTGDQLWNQASPGIGGGPESYDDFGEALAAGDFDGDGAFDLAAGIPGENGSRGALQTIIGSTGTLTAEGARLWSQDSSGVLDLAESGDRFAGALAP